ncbi:Yip1 family protein [Paenibacillus hamazuiensis]|uniref:Yip1 family protein n=1 Tax=Paenibacillus hamazuiensis TaxID=2936508 RepID=UPI00200C4662|nr:Yip1 family protein [Paenibacillus hamazuiensis]
MMDSEQTFNPWKTIWTRPRQTIRTIVDNNPTRHVIVLSMAGGFIQTLDRAASKNMGETMGLPGILLLALVGGAVFGPIGLYIAAAVLRWCGKLLGGTAASEEVRAALAWSNVPILCAGILWIPQLLVLGKEAFMKGSPTLEASPLLFGLFMLISVVQAVISIWAIVIFLKCLGEVHGFSAWRALGSAAIPFAAIIAVVLIITAAVRLV